MLDFGVEETFLGAQFLTGSLLQVRTFFVFRCCVVLQPFVHFVVDIGRKFMFVSSSCLQVNKINKVSDDILKFLSSFDIWNL